MRILPSALALLALAACGPAPVKDPGHGPIQASPGQWSFIPFEGSACGNGTATGIGVNWKPGATRVLVYLQGGGACWDQESCWGLFPKAVHIASGYGAGDFNGEGNLSGILFLRRNDVTNPFRDANLVFVPYCTGDLHAGTGVATYAGKATHHVGGKNLDAFLARLALTFPDADRVWLTGASAGGFGAALNLGRFAAAWPGARVDVVDDSGPLVRPAGDLWRTWTTGWGVVFPSACTACPDEPATLLGHWATAFPRSRFALLTSERDAVIASYTQLSADEVQSRVDALAAQMQQTPTQRSFRVSGESHVQLAFPLESAGGVTLATWLSRFASDDPAWADAGP